MQFHRKIDRARFLDFYTLLGSLGFSDFSLYGRGGPLDTWKTCVAVPLRISAMLDLM